MKKLILLLLTSILFLNCSQNKEEKVVGLISDKAMVVSARKEASNIGKEILAQGGNAFDAMFATELALAVSYPQAGNIGGGGFMIYRLNNGETGAIDYREKAPLAAHKDMYLDEKSEIIDGKSTYGAMAVGVPGTIAGIFEVHKRFGTLPVKQLVQPSIDLARKGMVLSKKQANQFNDLKTKILGANNYTTHFETKDWQEGDTLKFEQLAQTLERIQQKGRDEFYKGETAALLVNYIQELGGIITTEDLAKYEAKWRTPITFDYKGHKIISMTLPSSGGVCLAQILKGIEPFDLSSLEHNSTEYIQLVTESERRAYADRSHYLGDMDFVEVPIDSLIDDAYIAERMSTFNWEKATSSAELSHGIIPGYESNETTHYSIVDPMGNAVSVTTTLNLSFGSKVYVKDAGFFLNNEMDDFSSKPGTPNAFGLVGAEANAIAPEKRMLSSMTPTIVEKDGKLKMVVGSPGGSTIITSVMQNIVNVLDYNMGMQESVNAARFHHQWLPDNIRMEPNGFNEEVKKELEKKGYEILEKESLVLGQVNAILILEDGRIEGAADPRNENSAKGF